MCRGCISRVPSTRDAVLHGPTHTYDAPRRYQQRYSTSPLPQDWLGGSRDAGTDERLQVPAVNPFTPKDLAMLRPEEHEGSDDKAAPRRIVDDATVRM